MMRLTWTALGKLRLRDRKLELINHSEANGHRSLAKPRLPYGM
jgi:hypothetical protein